MKQNTQHTVMTALFTALIIASSYIALPIGPVPVVLTTLFVVLAGLLGGPKIGVSAVLAYIFMGLIGLPVFSGGSAGIGILMGPTGGFIIGYLPGALLAGLIGKSKTEKKQSIVFITLGAILGGAVIYLPGLPWLKYQLAFNWAKTLQAGLTPFIPGYVLKTIVAIIITQHLGHRFNSNEDK